MKNTLSILVEEFENEKTGEKVEGLTIMIDGMLKEFVGIMEFINPEKYKSSVDVVQDVLFKGLDQMRKEVDNLKE